MFGPGDPAAQVLQASRAMFVAGCCFDELPPAVIMEAVRSHRSAGGAVFFDPGPRSLTFRDPDRQTALHALLDSTDVVLMTQVSAGNCSACCLVQLDCTSFAGRLPDTEL